MVKKFSIEFKQQSVDYALSNAHLSISELANHLGVGKSTLNGLGNFPRIKLAVES
ncbi:transposase [Gilliamella sp. ESL0232]|uniref:transposase n=1 Tax=Gilliamella sp. ESL0232 TaxID=2705037 RepID=UPI001580C168|nr:transposase [Gilliamella sp. ESL0232]